MTTEPHTPEGEALRRQLYELMDDDGVSLPRKRRRALELGCEYLGVPNGHIQRRDADGTDTVIASVGEGPGSFTEGEVLDRARTYCRRTVERHSTVALSNVPEQGWADDPAYEEHGFECYVGTTIFVDGEVYGTVCFTAQHPRETTFSANEKAFVELIARLLGRAIETAAHERRIEVLSESRRRSEATYEGLLRLAPDAIFVVDAATGTIETVNERAASLTGFTADELRGMSVLDLHPEADRERYAALLDDGFDERIQSRFDDGTPLVIERSDGTTVPIEIGVSWVDIDDRTAILGIVRDITERREREQDLRIKEQAIEESMVGITITDASDPELPIVYANTGFEEMTGYSRGDAMGKNSRFMQGEGTDEETTAEIRRAIEAEEPIQTEILNYRADGTPFWNELTITPVMGAEGQEVTHYIGVQNDITAQKRRERLIEVLDRVLRHNLRNDMNVIIGFSDVIATRTDGEVSRIARKINRKAAELISLSNKVRGFETDATGERSLHPRDIREDIRSIVEELRSTYPEIEFDIDASGEAVVLATEQLTLALSELGDNAAKYGDGTTVRYEVTTTADGRVVVHVRDSGPGLPTTEQQVLESGRETPLEHGSGLGLWMVNWIVTGLGGDVTATVDDGTTVTITLPSATEADTESRRLTAFDDDSE
ncbi:MAG: PAS domain S-box protein [Halohasta sp.]